MRPVDSDVVSSIQRHAAMTWAQRLKRVFNIDIEVCSRCGGSARVIACIEGQDVIDRTLAQKTRQILTPYGREYRLCIPDHDDQWHL
jgi:hypothetical protein